MHCTACDASELDPMLDYCRRIGVQRVWFKCDHLNPSDSFKERGTAIGIAWAQEQGCAGIVCALSGNAASAAATYASRAGLPTYLVVSSRAPRSKLTAPAAHGARAFEKGTEVVPWSQVDTVVSGLDDPLQGYERDGTLTLKTVRGSGGIALAVSDEDTLEAGRLLARDEGIFVEPAAAASVAGASAARQLGHVDESEMIVCLLTGHGLKYQAPEAEPESVADGAGLIRAIESDAGNDGY